jgi:hypothetical protein
MMTLIDLIDIFKKGKDFESFCKDFSLDVDSEVIEIYMTKPYGVKSEIFLFEIEKTKGFIEYEYNGKIYNNLFDFYYFQDVINDFINGDLGNLSNEELALKLISYSINDA